MSPPSAGSAQVRAVARSGAFSLVGSITSALMGFVLILVLGRVLKAEGAGVVLQAIGAFTIALAITRAGLDTTAVWLLPRVLQEEPRRLRSAVSWLLAPSAAIGLVGGAALWWVGRLLPGRHGLGELLTVMAPFLPFAALMTVGLAATRGLGGVRTYVLIGSIAVPSLRPALVLLAGAVTAGAFGAALAWVAPLPIAAAVTILLLVRAVRRHEGTPLADPAVPAPALRMGSRVRRYALPRSVSAVLEQGMQWLDVILVGVLAGPAAAGIYGAASRLVAAGLILSTALRIVVAPLYSRSLGAGDVDEVRSLYTTTTMWIVYFSTPVFVILAAFGETMLGFVGPDFEDGATALLILAAGLLVVLLAGNVQSLLLMSGRSGLAVVNKTCALTLTLLGIVLLVPRWGVVGAATAWSVGMLLDSVLALWQVDRLVGVRLRAGRVLVALLTSLLAVGLPSLVARLTLGDTTPGLALALAAGALLMLLSAVVLRHRLELDAILHLLKLRQRAK